MAKYVVIVGGGVIGLCTAYYASQKGHRVTVIERGAPDHGGCSFGNAGMIVPSHVVPLAAPGVVGLGLKWMWNPESPFYIKPRLSRELVSWGWKFWRAATPAHVARSSRLLRDLALASRACFQELAESRGGDFGLAKNGLLMLCKSESGLHEESRAAEFARSLGMPVEVLTPEQTSKLDPGIRMDIAGSVYFPLDCHLSPARFMASLTKLLDQSGVNFEWSTEVSGWRRAGHRVEALLTDRREFVADEYVIAGGAWSPRIARDLDVNLPMQPGKGYSLTLPNPKRLPAICSILTEARVAVTPMGGALRFGGTMELAGIDESINIRRVNAIIRAATEYFPELSAEDFRGLPAWSGLRPCSPDGLPYVGRFAGFENLSAATGHAMLGLSLGPITGKLMAGVLSGEALPIDITALSPDRFD